MLFLLRKIKGGIRCIREHGIYYTFILFIEKFLNKFLGKKSNSYSFRFEKSRKSPARAYTSGEYEEHVKYCEQLNLKLRNQKNNEFFVPLSERKYQKRDSDAKVIAWYLPQFYEMEVNNTYHGTGFTEWTSSTRAIPLFKGHYQPHLPYDVGFYNLTNLEALQRQVELANMYGVYGFCFDYYWFSGERTMEKPIELFLENKELSINFCMNWCTENWTALWDGEDRNLIFEQKLRDGDDSKFMDDILPYMKDPRYITIDGRPVLMIYMCKMFTQERFKLLLNNFREYAVKAGFPGLYIMLTTASNIYEDAAEWGCDALVEYPTVNLRECEKLNITGYKNPNYWFNGILDYEKFVREQRFIQKYPSNNVYNACLVNFDNSPRKAYSSNCWITANATPALYKEWLKKNIELTNEKRSYEDNFTFVLAWNEWAEGACLEPDLYWGYGYLQATREAIEESRQIDENIILREIQLKKKEGVTEFDFYIHCIESLGDIVACEPIARYLKGIEPNSNVFWIVKKNASEILQFNPYVDKIIDVDYLGQSIDIINKARSISKNIIIDCHQDGRRCVVTNKIHHNPNNPQINEFTYLNFGPLLNNFCFSAGLPGLSDAPKFYLAPHIQLPSYIPAKYVVVHCKSAEELKDWDKNKWSILVEKIIADGYSVVEIGINPIIKSKNKSYIDATGKMTLQEIAKIIKEAQCFVGIDSVFAHFANCFGTKGVLIMGKYKYFNRPMMYTGNYADSLKASIIYAPDDGPAYEVKESDVYECFKKMLIK